MDEPEATLFGHAVGDGLDVEREQARIAIGLLRRILLDHMDIRDEFQGRIHVRFFGDRDLSDEELALVDALTREVD